MTQTPATARTLAESWPDWPFFGLTEDLLPTLEQWAREGEAVAIATLVKISLGSSPRPLGSEMAITASGKVAGYVSGGCVESAVATEALTVIATGEPAFLDYGTGSPIVDIQLTCGGRIGIFVRRVDDLSAHVARLQQARDERRVEALTIPLNAGHHGASRESDRASSKFTKIYTPPTRLLAAGGDPVTLALLQLTTTMGFEAALLRPYGPDAPPEGLPLVYYDNRPLASSLAALPVDEWTAAYTLTHDFEDDHAFLRHMLPSPAFTVGVLGSRSKIEPRRRQLLEAGLDQAQVDRLKTPAGLDIRARAPHEIALAILAEVIAERPARPEQKAS